MRGLFGLRHRQGSGAADHAAPLRQVMLGQILTMVAVALAGWLIHSGWAAGSAAFGGAIAGVNTLLLRWRLPARRVVSDPGFHLRSFYRSMVERMVGVAVLLWLGLAVIHFSPLWLLTGFLIGQLTWLAAGIEWRNVRLKRN